MWLLHTSTLLLHEFVGANIPPYAILSHTWGSAEEEVSFRDMQKDRVTAASKAGYTKVQKCCLKAAQDGYQYVWIDTCCIDKCSSAELSEAINFMYKWYQNAKVCYVYLFDVPSSGFDPSPKVRDDPLSKSRWFTRGWTLQELVAPRYIEFLGQDWNLIGTKISEPESGLVVPAENPLDYDFLPKLAMITGITAKYFKSPSLIPYVSSARKFFWAARRQATREEDIAYALMGLFGVNMPIL